MSGSNKPPAGPQAPSSVLRVLLVDDESVVAKVLAYMITLSGHDCTLRLSSLDASRLLTEKPGDFDLLVTDYIMPELDGLELINKARSAGFTGKAILISGQLDDGPVNTKLTQAFDSILRKPFSLEELQAAIKQVIK